MQLEMPHVNVLSKIDLLSTYGELRQLSFSSTRERQQLMGEQLSTYDTTPNVEISHISLARLNRIQDQQSLVR